jgi:hypothetical protein
MGVMSKLPDWQVIDGGRVGYRAQTARLAEKDNEDRHLHAARAAQLLMHRRLMLAGAWVEICETLEEVLDALVRWACRCAATR